MNNDGIQIRLGDILHVVWKKRKMIALMTVVGLLLGLLIFGMNYIKGEMSREYTVTASVSISTQRKDGTFTNGSNGPSDDDYQLALDMREGVAFLMKSDRVLSGVIDKRKLIGLTVKDIQNSLKVKNQDKAPVLQISLAWRSVDEGTALLHALISETEDVMLSTYYMGHLTLIDQPTSSAWNIGAKLGTSIWVVIGLFGFVAGVGIALLELILHPTVLNIRDVRTLLELDTIAIIPKSNEAMTIEHSILDEDSEKYKDVKRDYSAAAHILYNRLGKRKTCKCFYVTSAVNGEGKTTAAAHLAMGLADMEHKVLIVDLDMRNAGIGSLFLENIDYNHSLNAYYRGECELDDAILSLTGYLDILPAVMEHNAISIDNTIFELINSLKSRYEYIIIDTCSVKEASDALSLNTVAENAVFVIRYDYSTISDIQEALDRMDKSGVRIIGCIVNQSAFMKTGRPTKRSSRSDASYTRRNGVQHSDFLENYSDDYRAGGFTEYEDSTDNLIDDMHALGDGMDSFEDDDGFESLLSKSEKKE